MKPYTVIVMRPEWMREDIYDFFAAQVEAKDIMAAMHIGIRQAVEADVAAGSDDAADYKADYIALAAFEGHPVIATFGG